MSEENYIESTLKGSGEMRDLKFLLFIVAVLAVIAIITTVLVPIAKAANIEPRFALLAGTIVTVGIFWKLA